jgi:pimeloyl-ACP methyl ester carboxylesterase
MSPPMTTEPSDFAARTIDSAGIKLRCHTAGPMDGPLVLLLHGFPARWSTWRVPMRALAAKGFFVVAPDLRGFGESDKPADVDAYSIARVADDVAAIIHAFGRERACVAGHDFGGGATWATAMLRPEVVTRIAILNSVHPVGYARQMRKWSQLKRSWYVFLFQLPRLPEWFLARDGYGFVRRSLAEDGLAPEVVDDLLEGLRPPGAVEAAVNWYRASFRDGIRKRTKPARVNIPALVIWGDEDRYLDPELATPPADWVTGARVAHVPGASHWVQHDAPDAVTTLLAEHFRAVSSG